jgi:site-specific DNA-methyltransferase (adenine-specific)
MSDRNGRRVAPSPLSPSAPARRPLPTIKRKGITVYNADVLNLDLEPSSIDLIVTSPPYGVDVKYATFDDAVPYPDYMRFTETWLARCLRFIKPDGRLCLNVPLDKNKGGQQSVYADVIRAAKQAGWRYFSTIIWNEQNISRRTAWGSWLSASAPYVIAPVEAIALLYKESWEKRTKGVSDVLRDEFLAWTNGMWTFSGEARSVGHPAPFPVELPRRCIKLFSYVGETVLDPFAGSGSTLLACLATGRRGIGVEVSGEYCEVIRRRLRGAHLFEAALDGAKEAYGLPTQSVENSEDQRIKSSGS